MFKKSKYYSLDNILKKNATYYLIFGERSNGKTFACLERILKKFCESDYTEQGAVIRRWDDDLKGSRGAVIFAALEAEGLITKYTDGEYDKVVYKNRSWYLAKFDEEIKKDVCSPTPMAYAFALSVTEHSKSTSFPNITTILFDEFLTRRAYLVDEFVLFMNTLSTIIRQRDNVEIFMCGNTVNKYSPYFTEMGLKNVPKMTIGTIDLYTYGNSKLSVAVEYCASTAGKGGKKSDKYFAFDNPKLQMITGGAWELEIYPHCPKKYEKKNVKFSYFIEFENNLLQCDIVNVENDIFTFIHQKTTPLKNNDKDYVYSVVHKSGYNWSRRITKPSNKLEQVIYKFFADEKVFYQDNEIGEIVRNYILWCNSTKFI